MCPEPENLSGANPPQPTVLAYAAGGFDRPHKSYYVQHYLAMVASVPLVILGLGAVAMAVWGAVILFTTRRPGEHDAALEECLRFSALAVVLLGSGLWLFIVGRRGEPPPASRKGT